MASYSLGYEHPQFETLKAETLHQLQNLRQGPCGIKIRQGLEKAGEAL